MSGVLRTISVSFELIYSRECLTPEAFAQESREVEDEGSGMMFDVVFSVDRRTMPLPCRSCPTAFDMPTEVGRAGVSSTVDQILKSNSGPVLHHSLAKDSYKSSEAMSCNFSFCSSRLLDDHEDFGAAPNQDLHAVIDSDISECRVFSSSGIESRAGHVLSRVAFRNDKKPLVSLQHLVSWLCLISTICTNFRHRY